MDSRSRVFTCMTSAVEDVRECQPRAESAQHIADGCRWACEAALPRIGLFKRAACGGGHGPPLPSIGLPTCQQAAQGYPASPCSAWAVALTSWGSRPSLQNDDNVVILGTCDALETVGLPCALCESVSVTACFIGQKTYLKRFV